MMEGGEKLKGKEGRSEWERSGREGRRGGNCQRTGEKAFFSFCRALDEDDIVLLLPASISSEQKQQTNITTKSQNFCNLSGHCAF